MTMMTTENELADKKQAGRKHVVPRLLFFRCRSFDSLVGFDTAEIKPGFLVALGSSE